jgi:hypothetical protein
VVVFASFDIVYLLQRCVILFEAYSGTAYLAFHKLENAFLKQSYLGHTARLVMGIKRRRERRTSRDRVSK